MCGYFPVSRLDAEASTWRYLDAALPRASELGNFARLNTRGNLFLRTEILDSELSVRTEWAIVRQKDRGSPRPKLSTL